jgi:hypothetical protein
MIATLGQISLVIICVYVLCYVATLVILLYHDWTARGTITLDDVEDAIVLALMGPFILYVEIADRLPGRKR